MSDFIQSVQIICIRKQNKINLRLKQDYQNKEIHNSMPDKLLQTLKFQSTILPSTDPSPIKQSHKKRLSTTNLSNPEQDYSSTNWLIQNDQLFKIINMDNGNGVKDCKAMLDMMKEQFLQETEKLSLFYQPDLNQLLDSVKINDINVKRNVASMAGKEIQSKIKNIKIKKRNEIFSNYSKLMKYSLRENQRINFIKESAKIKQSSYEGSHIINDSQNNDHNTKHSKNQPKPQSMSILQRMMLQKRNKIAIQNSSQMNQEWKQLEGIMKNRAMCEKILEEALMFERYYHIMKKEKQKVLEGDGVKGVMDTGLGRRRIMTQTVDGKSNGSSKVNNQRSSQPFYKYRRASVTTRNQSSAQKPSTSIDPRHLRLPQSSASKSSSFSTKPHMSEQDYYRQKFMASLQRDQYLRQLNRVNDEIVQKKNMRNNCLIGNVLGLIRENTVGVNRLGSMKDGDGLKSVNNTEKMRNNGDKMSTPSRNSSRLGNQSVNRNNKKSGFANDKEEGNNSNNSNKVLTGSELTKILRRLFLIYSSNNSSNNSLQIEFAQDKQPRCTLITLSTGNQSLTQLSQQCLQQFFSDFNIRVSVGYRNDKIQYILEKDWIDQFEFIQLIHLLSASMQESSHTTNNTSDDQDGVIYTNINYWICKRILDDKNAHLLKIKEQSLLYNMRKDIVRLRKYYRLEETLNSKIDEFIATERISKLKIKTLFQGFDEVLEMLWSIRVYPQFVSKNTCRFYFQYLKEDKHIFFLDHPMIRVKRIENVIVENIIWLIVANCVINDPRVLNKYANAERERSESGHIMTKDKMVEKVFAEKFKLIIRSINNLTSKNNSFINATQMSDNDHDNDNNSQYSPVKE